MKNVLMIVPFFPPNAGGGVFRALSFVKYLEKYGWRTTVVTPGPGSYWVADESLNEDVPASCEVHRTRTLSGQSLLGLFGGRESGGSQTRSSRRFGILRGFGTFALIPDTYIGWYPYALRAANRLVGQQSFDAVFSTSPPETSHLVGYKIHRTTGIPWLADFRDPWTNLYVLRTPSPLHAWVHRSLEKKVCMNASVVVTNRRHKDQLERRFPGMRPVQVIANGYDHVKTERYAELVPAPEPCRILHAGTLTEKRSALPFLRGLKIFLDRESPATGRLRVLFVGPREDENDLAVRRLQLDSAVEFRDTVSHDEALQLTHTSHILLVIALEHQMPGKFFEYIGARRPILALVANGEVRDLVLGLRRGVVAPADDPGQIADRIAELYEKYASGTLDKDYDLSVVQEYQRETLTAKLADCLDALASRGSSS
jgi:glycosyltransferase involved in cell wall biosynthesis